MAPPGVRASVGLVKTGRFGASSSCVAPSRVPPLSPVLPAVVVHVCQCATPEGPARPVARVTLLALVLPAVVVHVCQCVAPGTLGAHCVVSLRGAIGPGRGQCSAPVVSGSGGCRCFRSS